MRRVLLVALLGCSPIDPVTQCVTECGYHRSSCLYERPFSGEKSEPIKEACQKSYQYCLDVCKTAQR